MLTILTQASIAILHDIASGGGCSSAKYSLPGSELENLIKKLVDAHLIRLLHSAPPIPALYVTDDISDTSAIPDVPVGSTCILSSYELCRPFCELNLLEILEATGEPIHCESPLPEWYYLHHGCAARKMGIANQMARIFLAEVKLIDW